MKFASLLLVIFALLANPASAKNYYKYTDANGNLVIKDYLPNQAIATGYQVLNENGRVIENVPAVLTDEQQKLENVKQAQLAEQNKKRQEQKRFDRQLLRQYNSVADIERTEERQTTSLKINVDIVTNHTKALVEKQAELEARAANFERRGKTVPAILLKDIATVKEQIISNQKSHEQYLAKIEAISDQFRRDTIRFKELQAEQFVKRSHYDTDFQDADLIYSCDDKNVCNKAWRFAQIFAHENASRKLAIITDTLIVTEKPLQSNEIGLSITRLPSTDDSMQIVLEINCFQSPEGKKICNSDSVTIIRQKFIDYLSRNSES